MSIIVCRTMFCPECLAHDRPSKGDKFVVYGSSKMAFYPRECHHDGIKGFTPHIITVSEPLKVRDNLVEVVACCGICGSSYTYDKQQISFSFKPHFVRLTFIDFQALVMRWVRTGYEII